MLNKIENIKTYKKREKELRLNNLCVISLVVLFAAAAAAASVCMGPMQLGVDITFTHPL